MISAPAKKIESKVLTLDLKGRLVWGVTLVLTPKAQEFD
jgi:hypothetical protein